MISIQNVSLAYGQKQVLDGFSLTLPTADITCLQGPSGCGKTTLLRLLAGLVAPDSGEIVGLPKKPAILFQEDRLLPHFTAAENIAAVLPAEAHESAEIWLDRVGLAGEGAHRPAKLSGGMRRRVALARTLAYSGDFLLLDEPFTGLDLERAEQMAVLIRDFGTPALVVAHSPDEIALLGGEGILVDGTPLRVVL